MMHLVNDQKLDKLLREALEEDIGKYDLTSISTIDESLECHFSLINRHDITLSGIMISKSVFEMVDPDIECEVKFEDGNSVSAKSTLIKGYGNARNVLLAERVALNFIQHLTGIATLTKRYVDTIDHTQAKILDTRKTTPLLRELEKYAVRCGGGYNHRLRLDDGVLIKDNHIAVNGSIFNAVERARKATPSLTRIEVECDTLEHVYHALEAKADVIMLDNMSLNDMRKSVSIVNGKALIEASGNMSLETVKAVAETGVDFISVGKLTHSAPNADIGLDITFD
ncbi:MAG: carboxylating nicotinate-nucleotide diphosphorylase [Rickettsiales bacterium]|nr:carboxylating nicotinate-nucleotide diphosphorylase [Rickettsiales bacterium]